MAPEDRAYFLKRAEAELRMAEAARHDAAGRAHAVIAGTYFDRAHNGGFAGEEAVAAEGLEA